VLGPGFYGVYYRNTQQIRSVVRRVAVNHFNLGQTFCLEGTGEVAKAVADVGRDVRCIAQAKHCWAACALLARAVPNRTAGAQRRTKAVEMGAAAGRREGRGENSDVAYGGGKGRLTWSLEFWAESVGLMGGTGKAQLRRWLRQRDITPPRTTMPTTPAFRTQRRRMTVAKALFYGYSVRRGRGGT